MWRRISTDDVYGVLNGAPILVAQIAIRTKAKGLWSVARRVAAPS